MDAHRFDALTRALTAGSRRGLLGLLATLPLVGGLAALLAPEESDGKGRRKRRKKPHHRDKKRRKPRRAGTRKGKGKDKKRCQAESLAETCAGACGAVKNTCGETVDCGSCACETPCPICQICQEAPGVPGVCVPDPATLGDACGECRTCDASGACAVAADGTACALDDQCFTDPQCTAGVCGGTPVLCAPLDQCHDAGVCDPDTGQCSHPASPDGTDCDDDDACTQTDECQGGVCTGSNPVVCNICQLAGTCDPDTGQCQADPAKRHVCGVCANSDEWCDGGACANIQATVTVIDCDSRCSQGTDIATAELCGQTVTCPSCNRCLSQTGCTSNDLIDGPEGPGRYCSTSGGFGGGGQPCSSNADCPSGLYCADNFADTCARICPFTA